MLNQNPGKKENSCSKIVLDKLLMSTQFKEKDGVLEAWNACFLDNFYLFISRKHKSHWASSSGAIFPLASRAKNATFYQAEISLAVHEKNIKASVFLSPSFFEVENNKFCYLSLSLIGFDIRLLSCQPKTVNKTRKWSFLSAAFSWPPSAKKQGKTLCEVFNTSSRLEVIHHVEAFPPKRSLFNPWLSPKSRKKFYGGQKNKEVCREKYTSIKTFQLVFPPSIFDPLFSSFSCQKHPPFPLVQWAENAEKVKGGCHFSILVQL